jgi:hypothetical protein
VTGPHQAASGPHPAVSDPGRADADQRWTDAGPRRPRTDDEAPGRDGWPSRPAPDPSRSIPFTGAAPGGWVGRPADPADETRLDDLTNPDLVSGPGRGKRKGTAGQALDAPAKRRRGDEKPPKTQKPKTQEPKPQKPPKSKPGRKTRGRDQDDLPAAAAATAASLGAAGPQRPAPGSDAGHPAEPDAARSPSRDIAAPGAGGSGRARAGRRTGRRRSRRVYAAVGGVVVIAGAAVAFEMLQGGGPQGPAHQIVTPSQVGTYVQAPALAASMKASQVRRSIVAQSNGEASNVVAAVYESDGSAPSPSPSASPGHGAASGVSPSAPGDAAASQIVLFIGGNLSGTSAKSFITSFIGKLPGAVTTAAGPLGGEAACVPSSGGNPAECAWADNDTFGLVASPTLAAPALASELRQMRLQVEHRTHQP